MSLTNVTLDDFSSYSFTFGENWQVPDTSNYGQYGLPQSNSFLNSLVDGTYHSTNSINSSFTVNFTGPSFALFGLSGPAQGSYSVQLDSQATSSPISAYSATNSSNHLLYSVSNLSPTLHSVLVTNLGATGSNTGSNLLVDYAIASTTIGATGSTATNTTVEDDNHTTLKYTGMWSSNNDTRFSGNTSTYTNTNTGSVSLTFFGSAVYVYGDTVIDHGVYQINLDNLPPTQYNAKTTDLKINTLKYFAGGLNSSSHTIKISNIGTTFFDLDRIVYTTPSAYYVTPSPSNATTSSSSSSTVPSASVSGTSSSVPASSTSTAPKSSANSNKIGISLISFITFSWILVNWV